ncbi:MAG: hypothetical protein IPO88_12490 [Nannocystis sp.]|uniref:hypothetical protein n=1 Tax=Nannocystis sp. TaxID=1962667 RepID=UPI002422F5F5|nr:hypothetical protein [Nannocystis sp.]MBK9754302.1 hypothetical protein [Nannocystis sp.]
MANRLEVQVRSDDGLVAVVHTFPAELMASGSAARKSFNTARAAVGVHLFLIGERDYHVQLSPAPDNARTILSLALGKRVQVHFAGRSSSVRRHLVAIGGLPPRPVAAPTPAAPEAPRSALDLTAAVHGAPPLFLLADGTLAGNAEGPAPVWLDALPVLVTAARWVSTRRTTSFECLFPASPFHPEEPLRPERLSPTQAQALLAQLNAVLSAAAPGAANIDPLDAAQLRSAALTVLSHIVATVLKDPSFRAVADLAAARIFALIAAETGPKARPDLRAHAISLLSMRGPALRPDDQKQAEALLRGLRRAAPPYAELTGTWRFVLNSASEFFPGEVKILENKYHFTKAELPADAPASPLSWGDGYHVLRAPFRGPDGQDILLFVRSASPRDENVEMGSAYFHGVVISRHANLGAFDMRASLTQVTQVGYKLMMNCQCAGLTTRFAISRMFPDADIYSSWDSTYFSTGSNDETTASEGIDCFHAILQGMAAREDFAAIDLRIQKAQWHHKQSRTPGFVQFIGPAHPLIVARYEDINRDGKADFYDGFLDLRVVEIAEAIRDSATPRNPGVAASQIGGDAARGLSWAAGSLNRVAQYSELWDGLPGQAENFYVFRAAGFYDAVDPPRDVPSGRPTRPAPPVDLASAPAVVRYIPDPRVKDGLSADVMVHATLAHAAQELKRLLVGADAYWRAVDLGYLADAPLDTRGGQRAGLLLLLAGLLEFPADPNLLDGLWEQALDMLRMPRLSRSLVRRCIDEEDHAQSNYYGSARGVIALIGTADAPGGVLKEASPVAFDDIMSDSPEVGRARPLKPPATA